MIIVSQNLTNYDMPIPDDAIFRINLAWVNDLIELKNLLSKHSQHSIFLDMPVNRTKPPNNTYSLDDLLSVFTEHKNIKYFAISNVNSPDDIDHFIKSISKDITLIPKIESPEGVDNINAIINSLPYDKKIIMLDHDDLYSSLTKKGEPISSFKNYFNKLVEFCDNNKIILLRTIGVIFSDDEKRVTQYIK